MLQWKKCGAPAYRKIEAAVLELPSDAIAAVRVEYSPDVASLDLTTRAPVVSVVRLAAAASFAQKRERARMWTQCIARVLKVMVEGTRKGKSLRERADKV